jgi:hypothetical protein
MAAISLILFSRFAFAESVDDLKKNLLIDQKKLVVMENMTLSEEEAAKFWPIFGEFQMKLYDLDSQHFKLLSFYLMKYKDNSLTDEESTKMIDAYFAVVENRRNLIRDFAFAIELEMIPVKKIFRCLQIQQNIDAVEQYEISQKVPLLE